MPYLSKIAKRLALAWPAVMVATAACGDQAAGTGPRDDRAPHRIVVTPSVTDLSAGDTARLSASVQDRSGASIPDAPIDWRSSNPDILVVDSAGTAIAVDSGEVTVVASSAGVQSSLRLWPRLRPVASVSVSPADVALGVGETATLTATTRDWRGYPLSGRAVAWGSSNPSVAAVDANGRVTAVAPGSASIVATSETKRGTATVNVAAPAGVPGTVTDLRVSATADTLATLAFTEVGDGVGGAANYDIRFATPSFSWGGSASVTRGTCRSPSPGTTPGATRTCTVAGLSPGTTYVFQLISFRGTLDVDAVFGERSNRDTATTSSAPVPPPPPAPAPTPVATVTVSPSSLSLVAGGATATLAASVRDASNVVLDGRSVTWSVTNPSIASISQAGVVTPLAIGSTTVTATSEGRAGTAVVVVASPPAPPPPAAGEPVPGGADVVIYDDDFREYATLEARHARRRALVAGSAPFYFYDGPDDGIYREAIDSIIPGGVNGSPYAYRIRVDYARQVEPSMYAQVFHRSGRSWHFAPDDATLVVDLWLRSTLKPDETLWVKGLMMGHSYDRSQYGWNTFSASLGWANVLPQSNNMEIYQHVEDGAADAPARFRRWTQVHDGAWHRHTMVYRRSSGTGSARDGLVQYWVDGEKVIDGSAQGLSGGWMQDRRNGVSASSTNPFPGNVGDKYTDVTGDAALRGLADDPVTSLIFPGIFRGYTARGGGTLDVGRIRIWYRQ